MHLSLPVDIPKEESCEWLSKLRHVTAGAFDGARMARKSSLQNMVG
jgi:hypothetical protein